MQLSVKYAGAYRQHMSKMYEFSACAGQLLWKLMEAQSCYSRLLWQLFRAKAPTAHRLPASVWPGERPCPGGRCAGSLGRAPKTARAPGCSAKTLSAWRKPSLPAKADDCLLLQAFAKTQLECRVFSTHCNSCHLESGENAGARC